MEAEIATQGHGTGIDVPEQGLHLRLMGHDGDGRPVHHGVLDTSMGPVTVERGGDAMSAWAHAPRSAIAAEEHGEPQEEVIGVPEQFVHLAIDGDELVGEIETDAGPAAYRDPAHL